MNRYLTALISIFGLALTRTPAYGRAGDLARAVSSADFETVKKCLEAGSDPNEKDDRGKPVLSIATASDQYRIAKLLIEKGADIWFADQLGRNAGSYTFFSRVVEESDEGKARKAVLQSLKDAGFPGPPLDPDDVVERKAKGEWPPKGAKLIMKKSRRVRATAFTTTLFRAVREAHNPAPDRRTHRTQIPHPYPRIRTRATQIG